MDYLEIRHYLDMATLIKNGEGRINTIIRRQIAEAMRELLSDPDAGLVLGKDAIKRIKKSVHSKKIGRYRSLEKIFAKYQL